MKVYRLYEVKPHEFEEDKTTPSDLDIVIDRWQGFVLLLAAQDDYATEGEAESALEKLRQVEPDYAATAQFTILPLYLP